MDLFIQPCPVCNRNEIKYHGRYSTVHNGFHCPPCGIYYSETFATPIANTYAKTMKDLQRTLDVQWLNHNFVKVHFTTKMVPVVQMGILKTGLSWEQMLGIRYAL
jgi:hypothetical protein